MIASDVEVKHGYTLLDLDQMTRAAVIADRSMATDIQTRKDIAWSAIAEHLAASDEPPHRQELIRTGWQAIYREARDSFRQRGRPDEAWSTDDGFRPRFVAYWQDFTVTPSHEHGIVEKLAADQVLDTLTPIYRDAIVALAVHDDYRLAAEALGLKYSAFTVRVSTARRQLLALWFEGETPRKVRRTDRRVEVHGKELATHCGAGHEWTPENTRNRSRIVRGKLRKERVCRACEANRGAGRNAAPKDGQR